MADTGHPNRLAQRSLRTLKRPVAGCPPGFRRGPSRDVTEQRIGKRQIPPPIVPGDCCGTRRCQEPARSTADCTIRWTPTRLTRAWPAHARLAFPGPRAGLSSAPAGAGPAARSGRLLVSAEDGDSLLLNPPWLRASRSRRGCLSSGSGRGRRPGPAGMRPCSLLMVLVVGDCRLAGWCQSLQAPAVTLTARVAR